MKKVDLSKLAIDLNKFANKVDGRYVGIRIIEISPENQMVI